MTTTTDTPIAWGELTNTCTCCVYDHETGDNATDENGDDIPSDECFGCWDDALYSFGLAIDHLWNVYGHGRWQVSGIRLWNGEVGGKFQARDTRTLVDAMTVNSAWSMTYRVFADRIEYSLSHHDAPMGSASVLRPLDDDSIWY